MYVAARTVYCFAQRFGFVRVSYFHVGFGLEVSCVQLSVLVPVQVSVRPALRVWNPEESYGSTSMSRYRNEG